MGWGWGWGGYGLALGLGWGYPGYYGGGYYGYGPGYGGYSYAPGYNYTPDPYNDYNSAPPYYGSSESAYYSPNGGTASANTVLINVRLPDPNAQVWFEGNATSQRGAMRQFESPQLTPGRDYIYSIRAEWNQNGRTVLKSINVPWH